MVKASDLEEWSELGEAVIVGEFMGRWESNDGTAALVAFEGRDVIGLLFGVRSGAQFRPVEARFVPEDFFRPDSDAVLELLEQWASTTDPLAVTLSTTGLREVPMGQMVARLTGRHEDHPTVNVPQILTYDVEHAATNNPQAHGFRNARELRSRIDQLRAAYHYVTALADGESAPLDYVAGTMKLEDSNPRARAGTLIQYARRNGYLTNAGGAGRAGGQLTDLAIEHVNRIAQAGARHV